MELQGFKSPFGKNTDISLSPDKLVGVLSKLMIWLKEYERFYYLCTFYDYTKKVYGLDASQQPPNTGAFGLIATMYQHFPSSLSTYVRRNFFDVDKNHGDLKYKFFAPWFLSRPLLRLGRTLPSLVVNATGAPARRRLTLLAIIW